MISAKGNFSLQLKLPGSKLGLRRALTSRCILALVAGVTRLTLRDQIPFSCLLHEHKKARGLESLMQRSCPRIVVYQGSSC